MISSATIGLAKILIGADASGVAPGVRQAERSLGKLDGPLGGTLARLVQLSAGAALAGAALAGALAKSSLETIDTQSKLARQLGGTVEGVQVLTRHADLAGISMEELTKAAERLNRKLGEAMRDGQSPAADALARIGLNAKELSKLDVDERMAVIADRIKALGLNSQQTADLLGQLGVRSGKLFNLFEEGGDAIRQAREDVKLFGVAVSSFDAKNIERANDAMTVFGLAAKGVGNQLAVQFAPVLEHVAEQFRSLVKEAGGMDHAVAPAVLKVVYAVGVLNREVQLGRVAWDNLAAYALDALDAVAGFIPRTIESLSGGMVKAADVGFEPLKHNFGKLKDELGTPPDPQEWVDWFQKLQVHAKIAGITVKSIRDAMQGSSPGPDLSGVGSKEAENLQKRFLAFQESLANEVQALAIHHQRQLEQIAEFEKKRIGTVEQWNALRLEAERKYQKDYNDLLQTGLLNDLGTELDGLTEKYTKRLELIDQFRAAEKDRQAYWNDIEYRTTEKFERDKLQLMAGSASQLAGVLDSSLSSINDLMGEKGEEGFNIIKALTIATSLVKGFEAALNAYTAGVKFGSMIGNPMVGQALGVTFAGIAAAGTAAMIAKIAGVGPTGGGSVSGVPSGGGGAPPSGGGASATAPVAEQGRTLVIEVKGSRSRFTIDEVKDFLRQAVDFQNNGGQINGKNVVIVR